MLLIWLKEQPKPIVQIQLNQLIFSKIYIWVKHKYGHRVSCYNQLHQWSNYLVMSHILHCKVIKKGVIDRLIQYWCEDLIACVIFRQLAFDQRHQRSNFSPNPSLPLLCWRLGMSHSCTNSKTATARVAVSTPSVEANAGRAARARTRLRAQRVRRWSYG